MYRITPPKEPLHASVTLPGSKSYTNRALIAASIAGGSSTLHNASPSDDSIALCSALTKLGVEIDIDDSRWKITRANADFLPFKGTIDVGPAGTTMRFLTALLATIPGCEVVLRGSERMHQRPIENLVKALRDLGASIEYQGLPGCPPLLIKGRQLSATATIEIDGSKSSQFVSAILLCAPRIRDLQLRVINGLVSKSYLEMALDTIRCFAGVVHSNAELTEHRVDSSPYLPQEYHVEVDASGASYFWGLAAVGHGEVTVNNINHQSIQGDMHFPKLLEEMGCIVTRGNGFLTVKNDYPLRAIECDMTLLPDSAQTLAVIAAVAKGKTTIHGLQTLRIKETDRLHALKTELARCNISAAIDKESICITGGTPQHGEIQTYEDHRMAMSFALLGALPCEISIHEPGVVTKSFPSFWQQLDAIGFKITEAR